MTDNAETRIEEITKQALDAAQLATEAAHEAEAAIAARNEAAQALNRTAQQTRWLLTGAAAGAVLVLVAGGLFWARASGNLHDAAAVQAAATAGFVENLMQMNDALDHMQGVIAEARAQASETDASLNTLILQLDQRLEDAGLTLREAAARAAGNGMECPDLLVSLAEVELNLARRLDGLVATASAVSQPPPAAVPEARPRAATPRPPAQPAPPPARRTAPAEPNPFRFP